MRTVATSLTKEGNDLRKLGIRTARSGWCEERKDFRTRRREVKLGISLGQGIRDAAAGGAWAGLRAD